MPRYEYKVVPAPTRGLKAKGVKGAEARFAHAVQELMNGLSGYGWEYLRAETLPSVERAGLTGTTTEWRNVLVFRRVRESDAEAFAPELLPAPVAAAAPAPKPAAPEANPAAVETPKSDAQPAQADSQHAGEAGADVADVSPALEKLAAARNADKSDA